MWRSRWIPGRVCQSRKCDRRWLGIRLLSRPWNGHVDLQLNLVRISLDAQTRGTSHRKHRLVRRRDPPTIDLKQHIKGLQSSCVGRPPVPPKYSDRSAIIEVDRLPSVPLDCATTPVHSARCPRIIVQDVRPTKAGKHRFAASTCRFASFDSQTAEADASRSNLLGMVAACVEGVEISPDDRQARDGRRLAPEGLPYILDVESKPEKTRSTQRAFGHSGFDPNNE